MKSKAHSKKCQEMGVLVSSLVDLEAEEGKILQLYKLAIASEKKVSMYSSKRRGVVFITQGSFQHPRVNFSLHWVSCRTILGDFIDGMVYV